MSRSLTHDLMPRTDHDGMSRRLAVLAAKRAVGRTLQGALAETYEAEVKPEAEAATGRPVESPDDFRDRLKDTGRYRLWSSLNRAAQHSMWFMLADQIDADYDRIAAAADALPASSTVDVSAGFEPPAYIRMADIHCQPGGYLLDRFEGDLGAGILYEMGGNIYALGQNIGAKDSKAKRIIDFILEKRPGFAPQRILELGCSAGSQTSYYPSAFPGAEVHAVDVSPGMLRYAKARADALGAPVAFHAGDAADLPFADASFDLIVSHNMLHETAASHMGPVLRECWRLLSKGGLCLHQDVAVQPDRLPPFVQFLSEWQKDNNGEPFWLDYAGADIPGLMREAGFPEGAVEPHYLKQLDGPLSWYVVTGEKPA